MAIFMENKPEYIGVWLGLSKIGVISALINTNLKSEPLIHSVSISKAKAVIFSSSLKQAIEEVKNDLTKDGAILIVESEKSKNKDILSLDTLLENTTSENI